MKILGISAYYHDSAACLVEDGVVVAAAQEERFTRKKGDASFPRHAVRWCLQDSGIRGSELDLVAFYDKPFVKFERLLDSYMACAPRGWSTFVKAMPAWIKAKLWMKASIQEELGYDGKILFPEHHESHAASAFYPSPFQDAAVLTMDGVGEWATASYGVGEGSRLELLAELRFPHSLGMLYSAFTYHAGFRVNSGEYKLMGLAPYGEPKYRDLILSELMDLKEDGSFRLDMRYFDYCVGEKMTNRAFDGLFGGPPRPPESKLTQRELDLAASVQQVTEEVMLRMARHVRKATGKTKLCLAGGVALNCVGNGRLLREAPFEDVWIQPAAGDAGGALGAALLAWHQYLGKERKVEPGRDGQRASLLGPSFDDDAIRRALDRFGASYVELSEAELPERVADLVADQKVIGWFQGRMEFGPRALGARSILGDARSPRMQEEMNLKTKFREGFRPFAPVVLAEKAAEWFELDRESPYMMLVAQVKRERLAELTDDQKAVAGLEMRRIPRSQVPAVTHVDGSARIQTVAERDHPRYYRVLQSFERKTGCPVMINTSFNVRGEPIVHTPEQAYVCFMRTNIDHLVIGRFLLDKASQKPLSEDGDWLKEFELD